MNAIDIKTIQIQASLDVGRNLFVIEILHVPTDMVIGAGIIPIWCGCGCENCPDSHEPRGG